MCDATQKYDTHNNNTCNNIKIYTNQYFLVILENVLIFMYIYTCFLRLHYFF